MTVNRPFGERFAGRSALEIQIDEIDETLRNGLWNAFFDHFVTPHLVYGTTGGRYSDPVLNEFIKDIASEVLHIPTDTLEPYWPSRLAPIRQFFMVSPWYRVYEFIEFVANHPRREDTARSKQFITEVNRVLQRDASGYRFLGAQLIRIADPVELAEIESARTVPRGLQVVAEHLDTAIRHLSSREKPDYRNSIKESISAVESLSSLLAGQDKADLDSALKVLERNLVVHPALKRAFKQLYGYTSDSSGIRHAMLEEADLTFEDAKFMLVTCAAFINYVKANAARTGLSIT